jgi:hypothetical protein
MPATRSLITAAEALRDALRGADMLLDDALQLIEALPDGAYDHPALAETARYPTDAISNARAAVRGDIESVPTWLGRHEREGE